MRLALDLLESLFNHAMMSCIHNNIIKAPINDVTHGFVHV